MPASLEVRGHHSGNDKLITLYNTAYGATDGSLHPFHYSIYLLQHHRGEPEAEGERLDAVICERQSDKPPDPLFEREPCRFCVQFPGKFYGFLFEVQSTVQYVVFF